LDPCSGSTRTPFCTEKPMCRHDGNSSVRSTVSSSAACDRPITLWRLNSSATLAGSVVETQSVAFWLLCRNLYPLSWCQILSTLLWFARQTSSHSNAVMVRCRICVLGDEFDNPSRQRLLVDRENCVVAFMRRGKSCRIVRREHRGPLSDRGLLPSACDIATPCFVATPREDGAGVENWRAQ
jgi:hypothetical protein